jgi:hypothetical protein
MIQNYLLDWQNKWLLRKQKNSRSAVAYQDAKFVGVLFNDEFADQYKVLNAFVKQLQDDGKRMRALTYFERVHSNPYDFPFDSFIKKDISPLGKIKNEKVSQFIDFDFDYLFCINLQSFPPFDYIMLQSKARCRVGLHHPGKEALFELMVKPLEGDSLEVLLEQMYRYAKALSFD